MRTLAVPALIPVMVMLVSGCGSDGIPLRADPVLQVRIQQLIRDGGPPVLFRAVSGGDWDRVRVFPGLPPLDVIESEIGVQLDVSDSDVPYEHGGVLVFSRDGVIQRAVRLVPYPFDGNVSSYGSSVFLARSQATTRSVTFIDPATLRSPRLR